MTAGYNATSTQMQSDNYANAAGTGAPTFPFGLSQTITALSDTFATKQGLKSYASGTTYNGGNAPTITLTGGGGTLTSVSYSTFIPYQLQDGSWRMRFNLIVALSSTARTSATLTVNGATWAQSVPFSALTNTTATPVSTNVVAASGDMTYNHSSGTTGTYAFSGEAALSSKPTWAY